MPELVLAFENRAAFLEEYEKNLTHGRAFVSGAVGLPVFSPCTLTIEHPETRRRESFACEVVMVLEQGSQHGTAVQFSDRSETNLERLHSFARESIAAQVGSEFDDEITGEQGFSCDMAGDEYDELDEQTNPWNEGAEGEAATDDDEGAGDGTPTKERPNIATRAVRLKNLTPQQRMQVARSSVQEDRVVLERLYGSAVWELLLHNPKITVPEVARMARKGTMPRPLLDFIADNEQWIRHSLIRRALLANPRLGPEAVNKVLRTLPARELKLVPQQTAYPPGVRQAATRLMRGS